MSEKNVNSNKSVISNFLWRFMERCGAEGVAFIVSIVLARLLAPEHYAAVALINVFITIMSVFVDCGFTSALIQKKNARDLEFSTVFYFNIVMCLFIYAILFVAAPFIAAFYKMPELKAMVRVSSIVIIISGVRSIQSAYVSKNMLFKRFFFSTLIGTIVAAVIGIIMAYMGFGTWALIAQHLINTLIDTIVLWITVKWRPKRLFSFKELKVLLSYGWKIFASSLLDRVYNNLRSLIIGKLYTSSDLSFYNKGKQFPNIIVTNINSSIDSVLLPTMSKAQDSREKVKAMTRRSMKTSIYIMAPLMMGLAFCAEPIIRLILTEKWLPCVPFMQIF
ncbi:MAG: lipopolysaccharide biosynthesis protein, partial [Ruminococcus sp.]|nr:lipopolysaccharide biosynthesis protein [Ruminococcus sp.]